MDNNILCGPVVGLVTQTTAIVLVEVEKAVSGSITLRHAPSEPDHTKDREFPAKCPATVRWTDLKPGTRYDVLLSWTGDTSAGTVTTLSADVTRIRVMAASCDRADYVPPTDMWRKLYEMATKQQVSIVLHIGDNVYIDEKASKNITDKEMLVGEILFDPYKVEQSVPYVKARKLLQNVPEGDWSDKREDILELYRDKYRQSWRRTYLAKVLANFSNLMILDDHEIRDNYGTLPEDVDPNSKEYFLAGIAIQVYHEYQRQLWDMEYPQNKTSLTSEFYSCTYGPLGVLMLDTRLSNTFYKGQRAPDDNTYFGSEQLSHVKKQLQFPDPRLWLFVTSVPLIFFRRDVNEAAINMFGGEDFAANINMEHSEEVAPFLELIHGWKGHQNDGRQRKEAILLAGDAHMAGFTDICHEGEDDHLICRQITTSPIQNTLSTNKYSQIRIGLSFTETVGPYSYKHYDWTSQCNFCFLDVDFADPDDLHYVVDIVTEDGHEHRDSKEPNWDKGVQACSCNCCTLV